MSVPQPSRIALATADRPVGRVQEAFLGLFSAIDETAGTFSRLSERLEPVLRNPSTKADAPPRAPGYLEDDCRVVRELAEMTSKLRTLVLFMDSINDRLDI